ncbi:MAG: nucleoid-associated protein [Armatimonadota bacterium]|nr:nucleoid-associated protein [bacterium]
MQSIEAVELNRLVIHGINNMADEPDIADKEEVLTEGLRHFFEEHIRNCLKSSSAKTAKFNGSDTTVASCIGRLVETPEDFVEQSKVIGLWFSHNMAKSSQVQTFLAVAMFTDLDTEDRYLALLKLDSVKAFVRKGDKEFDQIQILPDPSRQLLRFAVVRPYDDETRYDVLFRNQPASKDEDPDTSAMWIDGFLEAVEVATPRQMTQLVVKETEKWIQQNEEALEEESAVHLRNAVRTLAQTEEIDVEAIAATAIKDERQREEYVGRLLDKGLTETVFKPDREWAERSSRKTVYLCDDGVQISGPSDAIDDVIQVLPKTADRKTRVVIETRKFQQK